MTFQVGQRVARCLSELVWSIHTADQSSFSTLKGALVLAKCLKSGLWENSPFVSKQFERVGLAYSNCMVDAGLHTFEAIAEKDPRLLEVIVNRPAPFGNHLRDSAKHMPRYNVEIRSDTENETSNRNSKGTPTSS